MGVAPCTGAWIETVVKSVLSVPVESLPVRERGLKPHLLQGCQYFALSLPVRERGLKREIGDWG